MSAQLALFGAPPADDWNPRFIAYATAHGREPAAMLEHDRGRWPGGVMAGFMIWVSEQRSAQKASGT